MNSPLFFCSVGSAGLYIIITITIIMEKFEIDESRIYLGRAMIFCALFAVLVVLIVPFMYLATYGADTYCNSLYDKDLTPDHSLASGYSDLIVALFHVAHTLLKLVLLALLILGVYWILDPNHQYLRALSHECSQWRLVRAPPPQNPDPQDPVQ